MIIATGSVDINEATKLAQDASDSASDLADKMKNLKTSLDGTITESTNTPFEDGKEHNDGDMWLVMSGNVATSMYIYSGGSWTLKKWDVNSLAVEYLSALSANLGNVQAGNINGVNISGSTITGGTIEGSSIHVTAGNNQYWLDNNGLHAKGTNGNVWIYGNEMDFMNGAQRAGLSLTANGIDANNAYGIRANGGRVYTSNFAISSGSVIGTASGDVYFEIGGGDSSQPGAALHAASFNKMSQLSVKRNVDTMSGEEALAQVMATDVARYDYKGIDNGQQTNIGPIIDNENAIGYKKYNVSADMLNRDSDGISVDNEVGLLMAALQEEVKRNSDLSLRLTKLEQKMGVK